MPATNAIVLQIRGQVTSSVCRYTRQGHPLVELEIADRATGQTVCITHRYPDKGTASCLAARALAHSMRGQLADVRASNPRFKASRLECEADHITPPTTSATRADLA
jgi:hypothetical protein